MNDTIIQQLRQQIDAKYRRALEALEILREYLEAPEQQPPFNVQDRASNINISQQYGGRIRPTVLNIIRDRWATIDELEQLTRLDKRQIRGVTGAPDLRDSIRRRAREDGKTEYRFEEEAMEEDEETAE